MNQLGHETLHKVKTTQRQIHFYEMDGVKIEKMGSKNPPPQSTIGGLPYDIHPYDGDQVLEVYNNRGMMVGRIINLM